MIRIGNVLIQGKLSLAPMAAVSDSPFRQIARKMGAAFSYTEFASAEQILLNNKKSFDLFRFQELERPIVFQIFGNKLESIVEAAKRIEQLKPDIIDLNMGCSSCKIAHKGSGAGLLKKPEYAGKIIEALRQSLSVPVTAKIRLGWDQKSLNYKEVVHVLQESGVQGVSVHGRTKAMGYSGNADWNAIGEIKSIAKVPIMGNGDILSYQQALEKLTQTGVDGILIGRGAIGNPWIFSGIDKSTVSLHEIISVITEHLNNMLDFYGDYGLVLFRKHLVKYLSQEKYIDLKLKLLESKTAEELFTHLKIRKNCIDTFITFL